MSMAFYGGGAIKAIKTTPLLTIDEAMQATQRAAKTGYSPPPQLRSPDEALHQR